ncbi:RNA 2',3'-cyclic phosphodiesterase [Psychrobacillus sp. FSL H8-0484]|uniref:RNA 2',3'-cyclic phosphodiesterase n=1 Tax=Psychrobacillus sp. FSL H8-0484 TaxID=2921390 RepID=UPI0030FB49E9
MKSHYFLGIKVPPSIAKSIVEARDKTNLRETHKTLPVAEDLHITLFYVGAIEQAVLEPIIQSFQKIDWSSFILTTAGLEHFGNDLTPRVVYIGLEESDSLNHLQQDVMQKITNVIEINTSKDFHAHITIAKKWSSTASLLIDDFLLTKESFEVSKFSIFKINPTRIPRYEEVGSIQCRRV